MAMLLDEYLSEHFITLEELAGRCDMSPSTLSRLIREQLVMAPSYVISGTAVIESYVFGPMACEGSRDGVYFHPSTVVWVSRATSVVREVGEAAAYERLKALFEERCSLALADLNKTVWRLPDCFAEEGTVIAKGLQNRLQSVWDHHLRGTVGLCVANPDSEAAIARKEILQEKLSSLSENGTRQVFSRLEAKQLLGVIDAYAACVMRFSPVEYPVSSRRRLVDDLRPRVLEAMSEPG